MSEFSDYGPGGSSKWGDAARAGFQTVPDALLVKQAELGLDPTDIVVLLNLTSYWWFRDMPPFPRTNVVAKRMGVTPRTVQRSMKKLENRGYIRRGHYLTETGETMPAVFFDGLVGKLLSVARSDVALAMRMERRNLPSERSSAKTHEVSEEADNIPF